MSLFLKLKEKLDSAPQAIRENLSPEAESIEILKVFSEKFFNKKFDLHTIKSLSEGVFSLKDLKKINRIIDQRSQGYPLQYLLGKCFFYNHEYDICEGVLIPRPETEILVETIFNKLKGFDSQSTLLGYELGVGSGVISIELLSLLPHLYMFATDINPVALQLAKKNYEKISQDKVSRLKIEKVNKNKNILQPFFEEERKADFFVSNPPYVDKKDQSIQLQVIQHEPHDALFSPIEDSLFFYRQIALDSYKVIKKMGYVFLEIPHESDIEIKKIFGDQKWNIEFIQDLNKHNRVLIAQKL